MSRRPWEAPGHLWLAIVLALLLGAVLRTIQYAATPPLWYDEIAIALNVQEQGWIPLLFQPLLYWQVAPPGFLAIEKLAFLGLGDHESVLRLAPYLAGLVGLLLFWRVGSRYLSRATLAAALLAFALSPPLILFSGTIKQYSGDVAVTLGLILIALHYRERAMTSRRSGLLGILGGLAILASHPAVLVALGLAASLGIEALWKRKPIPPLIALCAGWLAGVAVVSVTALTSRSEATSALMEDHWWRGFPRLRNPLWLPSRLIEFAAYVMGNQSVGESLAWIGCGVVLLVALTVGYLYLASRDRWAALLLAVPPLAALGAATVRLLPFAERVSLFVAAPLLIAAFAGVDAIRARVGRRADKVATAGAVVVAFLPGLIWLVQHPPPEVWTENRTVLQDLQTRSRPGDRLVTFRWRGWLSALYYGPRLGLEDWVWVNPTERRTTEPVLRELLRRVDEHRGAPRVWLYMDGIPTCEERTVLEYADAIGRMLYRSESRVEDSVTVSAHLYDLSDRLRLRASSAGGQALPEGCGEVPSDR